MDYLRAVFKRTYFVVAGALGVIWTVAGFVLPQVEPSVPIGLVLLGGSVVAAQFLAWADMRAERDKQRKEAAELRAQLEVREKRKAIRETVGEFVRQGEEIKAWLEQAGQIIRKDFNDSTGIYGVHVAADMFSQVCVAR
ncbi:MAG TPA: hypothetical protein VHI71_04960 [Actinomycetota bacterium]|nr:hypothetical protein [Actinomycetota bacterium]